jgi:hypothetical protein
MAPTFLSFLSNKIQLLSAIISSAGAGDAGKIIATDPSGKIDRTFLNRISSLTDGATIAVNADTTDIGILASLSQTSTFQNPTGSPGNGQSLQLRVTSSTSRSISFDTAYQTTSALTFPTATTGGGKEDYLFFEYNTPDSKWDFVDSTIAQSSSGISAELAIAYAVAL